MTGLLRDRRGMVTILAAGGLMMTMAAAALAVDLGSVFMDSRRLQGVADAAALAAADDLPAARNAAAGMVAASGWPAAAPSVVITGTYAADPARAAANRFLPNVQSPNAAQVMVAAETPLFFGRALGLSGIRLARSATAARIDLAAFSLGTRLAAVNGGILNSLLGGLAGGTLALTAADYDALATADVDLLDFAQAIRTQGHLAAASFNDVLAAGITVPAALNALATTLGAEGRPAAAAAVSRIAAAAAGRDLPLSRLIDLGPLGAQDHVVAGQRVTANVLDLVSASLQLAGAGRQVNLDVGATVPGLTLAKVTLLVGARPAQAPWLAVTATGQPVIRTSQIRLKLEVGTASGMPPLLGALGVRVVRLPIYVELAQASARLSALGCRPGARSMTIEVQPSIGHVSLAEVGADELADGGRAPTESPASLVDVAGLTVTATARTDFSGANWQSLSFSEDDIAHHAVKTVQASGIATALAASVEHGLTLSVRAGPLALGNPAIPPLLTPLLDGLAPQADLLLDQLLGVLGIHLGQADVRADGTRCGAAALVG